MHANDANKLIFPELSYKLTGIFFEIHNRLGRYCRERQYTDALEEILRDTKISYRREPEIILIAPDSPAGNRPDFIVDNKVIIDIKAKRFIIKEDYYQMLRYLESAKMKLGFIVNFRSRYLKPKRVVNAKLASFV